MEDDDLEKRKESRQAFADKTQFEKQYWTNAVEPHRANGSAGKEQVHGGAPRATQ